MVNLTRADCPAATFKLLCLPVFLQTQAPVIHIRRCQLTFRFCSWARQMAYLAGLHSSLFPADCMMTRDILIKASSQVLRSRLPIPSNPKHMLPWSWLFTAEVHTRWTARQSSHFWVSFLCISYIRRMISITEKNKVLIHTLNGVNSTAGKGGSLLGSPVL